MLNPSYSKPDSGQVAGTAPSNVLNNPGAFNNQGSNTFDLSYLNPLTARYGEVTPFFHMEGLGRDRILLKSSHDLRSYTLSSPLMTSVIMRKSYFQMPLAGIMPKTWQYIFTNPTKGDDIPDDALSFFNLETLRQNLVSFITSYEAQAGDKFDNIHFKAILVLYLLVSKGSLLDYLGVQYHPYSKPISLDDQTFPYGFDSVIDNMVVNLPPLSISFNVDTWGVEGSNGVVTISVPHNGSLEDKRNFFYSLLEHPDYVSNDTSGSFKQFYDVFKLFLSTYESTYPNDFALDLEVNPFRLAAYQMVCSQFFSNDKVDGIYNSELWLSNMKSLVYSVIPTTTEKSFTLNGVPVFYDVLSNHYLSILSQKDRLVNVNALYFWFNLLSYRRSLRYGDYFTGARPKPLAVGDVNIDVNGSALNSLTVNAVDVNRNLWIQRFLNAANRVGSNLVNYTKGIFGYEPPKDYHQPNYIASESTRIGGNEIDNTSGVAGSDGVTTQGTVNVNLRSSGSDVAFDIYIDNPCIILGLVSFEAVPCYSACIEKIATHKDRYDMFNPYMQHIGDQQILTQEFNSQHKKNMVFGYACRYAEYKYRYSMQHGGFNTNLPSWSFDGRFDSTSINEDVIRSKPADFDKFYKSLQYASLPNYFHFIISFANSVQANRAMQFFPDLT